MGIDTTASSKRGPKKGGDKLKTLGPEYLDELIKLGAYKPKEGFTPTAARTIHRIFSTDYTEEGVKQAIGSYHNELIRKPYRVPKSSHVIDHRTNAHGIFLSLVTRDKIEWAMSILNEDLIQVLSAEEIFDNYKREIKVSLELASTPQDRRAAYANARDFGLLPSRNSFLGLLGYGKCDPTIGAMWAKHIASELSIAAAFQQSRFKKAKEILGSSDDDQ